VTAPGLVIFDCDGVLVDSEGISLGELTRAIAAAGGTMTLADVHAAFHGETLEAVEAGVAAHLGGTLPHGFIDGFLAARRVRFERELTAVPGAGEAVREVHAQGWETCVASQGRVSKMEQTLRVTGLDTLFPPARVFSATMVERGKPAPDLFLHAAQACGFAPQACVVVEDSPLGVSAARAAGMRALGYVAPDARGNGIAERLTALGAEVFHDMREVPRRVVLRTAPAAPARG
jgi:beta-phosphoglucomutase-like phosphatase (HAD superfamily)